MSNWQSIYNYYSTISSKYSVNPIIFISIHVVCTPLLMLVIWWLIRTKRQRKPIIIPILCGILLYNIANVYLIIVGKNIPLYIYLLLFVSTIYSGYLTVKKLKEKLNK